MAPVSPPGLNRGPTGDEGKLRKLRGQARLGGTFATRPGRWYCTPARSDACTRFSWARWISRRLSEAVGGPAGGIGDSLSAMSPMEAGHPDRARAWRPAGIPTVEF